MKILLINKFLYPRGGDAIVTLSTGDLLESHGHQVIYWGMKSPHNRSFAHSDLFIDEVDLNDETSGRNKLRIAGNLLYSLEARTKIKNLIKRIGVPDMIHLHNFAHQISPSILHVFERLRIPCVMTMHDYKMVCATYTLLSGDQLCDKCSTGAYWNCFQQGCVKSSKAKSLLNTAEMYLHHRFLNIYKSIDTFISPSQFMKDKVAAMGFRWPVKVLPNFINGHDYSPESSVSEKVIGYVGRLSKEKGIATLIQSIKNLPDVQLKIMGDGPLRGELQEMVRSQNMSNILFLGHLTAEQLKKEMGACMFMVCPSEWYENNPRSVIESFALGKPVIGARIGGIPELVRDDVTGMTFTCGNAGELRYAISRLTANPDRCTVMGQRARQWVLDELNPFKHYRQLISIYQQAINRRKLKTEHTLA